WPSTAGHSALGASGLAADDEGVDTATDEGGVMQTFSIGPGNRWWIQVITCNPLVRRSDRIELVVITCAALLTILAVPIAGAIGTSVHDERTRLYAAEAQARHQVLATATQNGEVVPQLRSVAFIAAARWTDSGISHNGTVAWPDRAKLGDQQR